MLKEFYGKECPHCHNMIPLIKRLQKEGTKIEQYEVWHNDRNLHLMKKYDRGLCAGVPFFFNTKTGSFLCGETTYEILKKWSKGAHQSVGHSPLKDIDYTAVSEDIFIGTNQCCQTHFDEALKKEGIQADISLEEERVDAPFGVPFYVWIPIKNHSAPTQEQLDFGVFVLEKFIAMKKKIYVHCENGHGRAPTLVAAYFIKQGTDMEEAIERIRKQRPSIHLEDVQKQSLKDFAERLHNGIA